MKFEQAQAEQKRAQDLLAAYERLATAKRHLDLVNAHVKSGQSWTVDIALGKKDDYRYDRQPTIYIKLPGEIVQQQAVDTWKAARRQVVLLGGEL